ncbi:hypothetical protein EYF80_049726 [Liparis tanakae]|uniref:Uncharacterized protein n=1 Tax=Liparis tanakae TaxID=230148 RepID=A0A4Z2FGQ4_9TELE|nr:hypothetical protein EYF80_049726 [Liparis tanakae]
MSPNTGVSGWKFCWSWLERCWVAGSEEADGAGEVEGRMEAASGTRGGETVHLSEKAAADRLARRACLCAIGSVLAVNQLLDSKPALDMASGRCHAPLHHPISSQSSRIHQLHLIIPSAHHHHQGLPFSIGTEVCCHTSIRGGIRWTRHQRIPLRKYGATSIRPLPVVKVKADPDFSFKGN